MVTVFRIATENDLDAIVNTYNATIPSHMVTADLEPVSVESRIVWFKSHDAASRPLWIVEADGTYAGWISLRSFYGRPAYNGVAEVGIYLEAAFQGKGLGTKCLAHVIGQAPKLRLHTLLGFIFGHNNKSLALFLKAGFDKWGLLPAVADMNGKMRDLVILGMKTKGFTGRTST